MEIQATNNFVWVKRDEASSESAGLYIPVAGRPKLSTGTAISVGGLTKDIKIKKGKKCFFHGTVGFEVEYEGEVFLVLNDEHIIGVL